MADIAEFRCAGVVHGRDVLYFEGADGWRIKMPSLTGKEWELARFPSHRLACLWAASIIHDVMVLTLASDDTVELGRGGDWPEDE